MHGIASLILATILLGYLAGWYSEVIVATESSPAPAKPPPTKATPSAKKTTSKKKGESAYLCLLSISCIFRPYFLSNSIDLSFSTSQQKLLQNPLQTRREVDQLLPLSGPRAGAKARPLPDPKVLPPSLPPRRVRKPLPRTKTHSTESICVRDWISLLCALLLTWYWVQTKVSGRTWLTELLHVLGNAWISYLFLELLRLALTTHACMQTVRKGGNNSPLKCSCLILSSHVVWVEGLRRIWVIRNERCMRLVVCTSYLLLLLPPATIHYTYIVVYLYHLCNLHQCWEVINIIVTGL